MGASKKIDEDQFKEGNGKLQAEKADIYKRRKERKRSNKHMLKALTFGIDKTEEEFNLEQFKKKRQFLLDQSKVRKEAVENIFPFTRQ